jgi:hypothetical protein
MRAGLSLDKKDFNKFGGKWFLYPNFTVVCSLKRVKVGHFLC